MVQGADCVDNEKFSWRQGDGWVETQMSRGELYGDMGFFALGSFRSSDIINLLF